MPVNTPHPLYETNVALWCKCRDVVEGEEAVKRAKDKYLPKLDGADNQENDAYIKRASFYSASDRTVKGLAGAVFRKPPEIEFPDNEDDVLDDLGYDGDSLLVIAKNTLSEVLAIGRFGLLVDAPAGPAAGTEVEDGGQPEGGDPYVTPYYAENIINWRTGKNNDGREQLVLVVLKENNSVIDEKDPFKMKLEDQYRVLRLVGTGDTAVYTVEVWNRKKKGNTQDAQGNTEQWEKTIEYVPKMIGGTSFNFIPFLFFSPEDNTPEIAHSPIMDLVNVNLGHYRNSADLEHGLHFTALPTAWVSGFDPGETKMRIGSSVAWVSKFPEAKAGYLEFSGAGLASISTEMENKEKRMAILGARLLESQKRAVEAAESIALRQSGESSVLTNISVAVSEGLSQVMQWVATWMGLDATPEKCHILLNQDFGVGTIDGPTLLGLLQALQQGAISWEVFFYNMKRSEFMPDDLDEETERAQITDGPPVAPPSAMDQAALDAAQAALNAPPGGPPANKSGGNPAFAK